MTPDIPPGVLGTVQWVLLGAAVLVVVVSAAALLLVRDRLALPHLLTPVTSVAGPALGTALALRNGLGAATAVVLMTVGILALVGAALQGPLARALGGRGAASDGGDR